MIFYMKGPCWWKEQSTPWGPTWCTQCQTQQRSPRSRNNPTGCCSGEPEQGCSEEQEEEGGSKEQSKGRDWDQRDRQYWVCADQPPGNPVRSRQGEENSETEREDPVDSEDKTGTFRGKTFREESDWEIVKGARTYGRVRSFENVIIDLQSFKIDNFYDKE